jgi:hypothetical protein
MIHVTQATYYTYGGRTIVKEYNTTFHEPLWKVKELLLDFVCKADDSDPIVKLVKLKYREYGKD